MPTNYIKVRPYVAKKLGVLGQRYVFADGNVMLWDKDLSMVDVGWPRRVEEVVARIGGLLMDPYRTHDEQHKKAEDCTPLPMPTDPEWMGFDEAEEVVEEEIEEAVEEALDELSEEEGGEL